MCRRLLGSWSHQRGQPTVRITVLLLAVFALLPTAEAVTTYTYTLVLLSLGLAGLVWLRTRRAKVTSLSPDCAELTTNPRLAPARRGARWTSTTRGAIAS